VDDEVGRGLGVLHRLRDDNHVVHAGEGVAHVHEDNQGYGEHVQRLQGGVAVADRGVDLERLAVVALRVVGGGSEDPLLERIGQRAEHRLLGARLTPHVHLRKVDALAPREERHAHNERRHELAVDEPARLDGEPLLLVLLQHPAQVVHELLGEPLLLLVAVLALAEERDLVPHAVEVLLVGVEERLAHGDGVGRDVTPGAAPATKRQHRLAVALRGHKLGQPHLAPLLRVQRVGQPIGVLEALHHHVLPSSPPHTPTSSPCPP